jgi:hypothetical protein
MAGAQAALVEWYKKEHGGRRRLEWCLSVGNCSVSATFPAARCELVLANAMQAAALLLFEDPASDGTTLGAIVQRLQCSLEVGKRLVHPLVWARVLKKHGSASDAFAFNPAFSSSLARVTVPCASLEETHDVVKIVDGRQFVVEACIVRIMKARKTLLMPQLMGEVLHQLEVLFSPNPTL